MRLSIHTPFWRFIALCIVCWVQHQQQDKDNAGWLLKNTAVPFFKRGFENVRRWTVESCDLMWSSVCNSSGDHELNQSVFFSLRMQWRRKSINWSPISCRCVWVVICKFSTTLISKCFSGVNVKMKRCYSETWGWRQREKSRWWSMSGLSAPDAKGENNVRCGRCNLQRWWHCLKKTVGREKRSWTLVADIRAEELPGLS